MNLQTDAVANTNISCTESIKNINRKVLENMEKDLEEFEKISILFLMTADVPGMYEKVIGLCENLSNEPNIIGELVKNDPNLWDRKLIEALSIINNREVLKSLGFSPSDVIERYCQNVNRFTVNIHPALKVLYKLFETMDSDRAKSFLQNIYEKDGIKSQFRDNDYLELHALYWLRVNYISISPDGGGDLTKLLKHIKHMGYYNEIIYQDIEHFSIKSSQSDDCSTIKPLNNSPEISEQNVVPARQDSEENHSCKKYKIKKGKCVIINEENFLKIKTEYEKREGTRKDSQNLRRTFTGLGFDVKEYLDLTEEDILNELKKVSQNFDNKIYDCLVVVILSHGYEGGIVSSDGNEIPIKIIEDAVCTERLQNVVKILIVQACQGKITGDVSKNAEFAFDGPMSKSEKKSENIRRLANYARFMSTMNGFNAIRHKEEGSWFILAVCDVLTNSKNISVSQWSSSVTKKVREKYAYVNDCPMASQIPELICRLEAEIYFPPYKGDLVAINENSH